MVRNGNVILIGISQFRANVSDHDGYRCRLERSRRHRRSNSRGTMAWTRELTNNHSLFMRQLRRFIYGASRPPLWPPLVYRKRDMFDYHPRWTKKIAKGRLFLELETSIKRILDLFLASIFIELRN